MGYLLHIPTLRKLHKYHAFAGLDKESTLELIQSYYYICWTSGEDGIFFFGHKGKVLSGPKLMQNCPCSSEEFMWIEEDEI